MDIPNEIMEEAEDANSKLMPEKSRSRYEKELTTFNEWREKKSFSTVNETVVLAYLSSLSKCIKASSLWTKFSMLKKALVVNYDVDISRFGKIMAFMKNRNVKYVPKNPKILSVEECRKFILEASDDFLLCKVVLIFGLYGACRRDELVKLTVDDIEDRENYALVKLQDTKTRSFVIPETIACLNPYEIYQKYAKLRPRNVETRRFFLGYRLGKCVAQPAGMHTIGGVPRKVAEFLGLDHVEKYTGHCLRRIGARIITEPCEDLLQVKQTIGEKSLKVEEEYVEESTLDDDPAASPLREEVTISRNMCAAPAGIVITGNYNCTINVHMCKHDSA